MTIEAEERVITDAALAIIAAKDAKKNQMKLQEVLDKMAHDLDWRGPTGKPLGHIVLSRDDASTLVNEIMRLQVALRCISQRASYGIVTPGQKEMADMADDALAHD